MIGNIKTVDRSSNLSRLYKNHELIGIQWQHTHTITVKYFTQFPQKLPDKEDQNCKI